MSIDPKTPKDSASYSAYRLCINTSAVTASETAIMDSHHLTAERAERRATRDAKAGQMTDIELGIAQRYIREYTDIIEDMWPALVPASLRKLYYPLSSATVALCAVARGMSCVADPKDLSTTLDILGKGLEDERYGFELRNDDKKWAAEAEAFVKKANRAGKSRRSAMRALAAKKGFGFTAAARRDVKRVGWWLFNALISGPVFKQDEDGFLSLTDEALKVSGEIHAHTLISEPVHLPLLEAPKPWESPTMTIDGYHVPLVRSFHKMVQRVVSDAIKCGQMDDLMFAVSAAQSTEWKIDQEMVKLVEWAFNRGLTPGKFPSRDDTPLPTGPDNPTEDQKKMLKRDRAKTRELNRSVGAQREQLKRDIATADWIKDRSFWTPCNLDYRGRMYSLPSFNFQRGDYVRAMFRFANSKPLGEHGLYWLKVHVANCWASALSEEDRRKTDKVCFDERVQWVDSNERLIVATALSPRADRRWLKADAPFMFVAACRALDRAIKTGTCNIPVSFDGSCSGLQHLAAMTRDEKTASLVNLSMSAEPGDVYRVVAELVAVRAELDFKAGNEIAGICLSNGIDRSLVKRNVMTFCYGSKQRGMRSQLMKDVMDPYTNDVMRGELAVHPYGDEEAVKASATYLATLTYEGIKDTVSRPHDAMVFLQGVARALAHEEKPTIWHTPLGLPVVHYKPTMQIEKLQLFLNDRGVKKYSYAVIPSFSTKIDKVRSANGIAPSFVHSLDANHLHCVTLACADAGITDLALVHDSFGCHAGDAEQLREIIKEEFKEQYASHDVLLDIMREAAEQLDTKWDTLPMLPSRGDYDINSIMKADYAFA